MRNKILLGLLTLGCFIAVTMFTNPIDAWIKVGTYYAIYDQNAQAQSIYGSDGTFASGIKSETFPIAFSATPIVMAIVKNVDTAEYIYIGELSATAMKLYSSDGSSTSTFYYTAKGQI